jgi:hypothetical protein
MIQPPGDKWPCLSEPWSVTAGRVTGDTERLVERFRMMGRYMGRGPATAHADTAGWPLMKASEYLL